MSPIILTDAEVRELRDKGRVAVRRPSGYRWQPNYGTPCVGQVRWVRERWQPIWEHADDDDGETRDWQTGKGYIINYPATDGVMEWWDRDKGPSIACRSPITMPRWASRFLVAVTSVTVRHDRKKVYWITVELRRIEEVQH